MHSPSVASLKLSFSLLTSKPRLSKVHGLDLYLSFILGICTDVTCSKYKILKISCNRVSSQYHQPLRPLELKSALS